MPVPPVFDLIAKTGKIPERDITTPSTWAPVWFWPLPLRTLPARVAAISAAGEQAYVIGECVNGAERA